MIFDLDQCKSLKQKHEPAHNQVRADKGEGGLSFKLVSMSATSHFVQVLRYVLNLQYRSTPWRPQNKEMTYCVAMAHCWAQRTPS